MSGNPVEIFVQIVFVELAESQKIGFANSGKPRGTEPRALIESSCHDLPQGEPTFARITERGKNTISHRHLMEQPNIADRFLLCEVKFVNNCTKIG